jgi:hypothetical protein
MARPKQTDALSIADLKRLISERKGRMKDLKKQRNKILKQLTKIEKQIEIAGGEVGGRRGGTRPKNSVSLVDAIAEVLKSGKPMRVPEIAKAVQDNGYKSTSPKFTSIVNQALIKDKRFGAVERGIYAMKK